MKLDIQAWPQPGAADGRASPHRVGFFTDTSICIGCKACEVACKEWNHVPEDGLEWTGMSFDNTQGLPEIYDRVIDANDTGEILVFVHDDVWLEDFYFSDRVIEGLKTFDVIGVAGNTRRLPGQDGWARSQQTGQLDLPHLRGAIAHGDGPLGKVGFYGPIVGEVEMLDGVFIAARRDASTRDKK